MDSRAGADKLAWDDRLPIISNVFLWYDLAKVYLIVYVVVMALLGTIFSLSGEPQSVLTMAPVFAVVCGGLFAMSVPIAAVWYANRAHVRFELTAKGVLYRTLEHKDQLANRALFILGVLLGKPSAAGAGLLAASREAEFTKWTDVTRVNEHPRFSTISLVCGWRVAQRLHCQRDDYPRVAAFVRDMTSGAAARKSG
jgi:hypothetical protein